jgi:hypothetical protein
MHLFESDELTQHGTSDGCYVGWGSCTPSQCFPPPPSFFKQSSQRLSQYVVFDRAVSGFRAWRSNIKPQQNAILVLCHFSLFDRRGLAEIRRCLPLLDLRASGIRTIAETDYIRTLSTLPALDRILASMFKHRYLSTEREGSTPRGYCLLMYSGQGILYG